jgi:hypothetical protein
MHILYNVCTRVIAPAFTGMFSIGNIKHSAQLLMSHRACCHTCFKIQLVHYSHFKTRVLLKHMYYYTVCGRMCGHILCNNTDSTNANQREE